MKVDGKNMRPIWFNGETRTVQVIDQRFLPHQMIIKDLPTVDAVIHAIKEMVVRGAPLIGATGAFGVYVALKENNSRPEDDLWLSGQCDRLRRARPTATNLCWGVDRVQTAVTKAAAGDARIQAALDQALAVAEEEAVNCRKIGEYGLELIQKISERKKGRPVNILTHCNAGWLACIEYGTATAPVYAAFDAGINVHVWVDETRPLNQGARLTAWELGKYGIAHTVITDNAGGHLMQHNLVDLVIVGTDRTTRAGDVANKIGTYLKALGAKDNNIPFYVALPSSTFDWSITDGIADIPIEERDQDEIRYIQGWCNGEITQVLVPPENSPAANHAFDVTPARLVTGFITERGMCAASEKGIKALFSDKFTATGKTQTLWKPMITDIEKKVIALLQTDIPVVQRPFQEMAQKIGITEEKFLQILTDLNQRGIIRRFGATLKHQKSGFKANAMVAWKVDESRVEAVGNTMAGFDEITHCYRRDPAPGWEYNLYTMVHAADEARCRALVERIAKTVKEDDYTLLFSKKELKKTSMKYFED